MKGRVNNVTQAKALLAVQAGVIAVSDMDRRGPR